MLKYFAAIEAAELGAALLRRTRLCWGRKRLIKHLQRAIKRTTQIILLKRWKLQRVKY